MENEYATPGGILKLGDPKKLRDNNGQKPIPVIKKSALKQGFQIYQEEDMLNKSDLGMMGMDISRNLETKVLQGKISLTQDQVSLLQVNLESEIKHRMKLESEFHFLRRSLEDIPEFQQQMMLQLDAFQKLVQEQEKKLLSLQNVIDLQNKEILDMNMKLEVQGALLSDLKRGSALVQTSLNTMSVASSDTHLSTSTKRLQLPSIPVVEREGTEARHSHSEKSSKKSSRHRSKSVDTATLSRSPEHTEDVKPKVFEVTLMKQNGILGMGLGGGDDKFPIFVHHITSEGAVSQNGQVSIGDKLLEVNGEAVAILSNPEAIKVLQEAGDVVTLRLCRDPHFIRQLQHLRWKRKSSNAHEKMRSSGTTLSQIRAPIPHPDDVLETTVLDSSDRGVLSLNGTMRGNDTLRVNDTLFQAEDSVIAVDTTMQTSTHQSFMQSMSGMGSSMDNVQIEEEGEEAIIEEDEEMMKDDHLVPLDTAILESTVQGYEAMFPNYAIFNVTIQRGTLPLGITIANSSSFKLAHKPGVYVASISKDGAVAKEGTILKKDRVLRVDQYDISHANKKKAAQIMKAVGPTTEFTIARKKPKN